MRNRILKYIGYILFGIIIFVLLVYVRFPRESIKEWIIISFENSFSYNLVIKDLHPVFPVGLDFRDIHITANREAPLFQAARIKTNIRILPLLTGNLNIKYTMDAYEGVITGDVKNTRGEKGKESVIVADIHNVNLAKHILLSNEEGVSVSGRIEGKLKVVIDDFDGPGLKGDLIVKAKGGEIKGIKIKGMAVEDVSYEGVDCAFELIRDKLHMKGLSLRGKDVDLRIAGSVLLKEKTGKSPLNLKVRIKPKKGFERRYRLVFRLIRNMKDNKGYFTIPVKGTLENPEVSIQPRLRGRKAGLHGLDQLKRGNLNLHVYV